MVGRNTKDAEDKSPVVFPEGVEGVLLLLLPFFLGYRITWGEEVVVEGVAYAGDTELEETDEASVLALAAASSSSKGFLPQHRVVIMQWRNCLFRQM